MVEITLPYHFEPRPYQVPLLRALDNGATRAVAIWHRRAGKDKVCLNWLARQTQERVGAYFYAYPEYSQGKKAIWEGRDRDGFPYLAHFPPAIVKSRNESELKLVLNNGSIFQVVGTSNINALMSTNPVGVVMAEYPLQDPAGWDYLRPILRENGGWALFNGVPRGKNHGYDLYELALSRMAAGDPTWYAERLSVVDTDQEELAEAERRDGMDEELVQQEYYCSFSGVQEGALFARQMNDADVEGRICELPALRDRPVSTWWDLGMRDPMAIWFTQDSGPWVHVVDYYEDSGGGLPAAAKALQDRGYTYQGGTHNAPHDIQVRELGSGKSRIEVGADLGIRFNVVPNIGKQDGIDAARAFLPRCRFDREKTSRGRDALMSYHRVWDDRRKAFSDQPYHDWSSNGADAFRYLAVGHKTARPQQFVKREPEYRPMPRGSEDGGWMAF